MPAAVALIIRCFNEEAHIGRLLTGVTRQSEMPEEIIVVDSGSTDATLAIASAFDVQLVSIAPERFSFGHALNVGIAASTAELVVFASAHVYPLYDTWIEHLLEPFEEGTVALTYGRQQGAPHGRFSEQRLLKHWFPEQSARHQRHPFCNNANAAIRRCVWEQQRYDERLTGLEDLDWAKHAMEMGHSIAYVAEAPVVHVHQEPFALVVNRYRREAIAHKEIYREQEMGLGTAVRLALVNVLGDYREAHRTRCLRRNILDIPRFRAAQFFGTYRGFMQSGPVTDVLKRRFYYPLPNGAGSGSSRGNDPGRLIDYDDPSPST
ncbi:MAG TPA: glycosyltransferase family 2 protein [Solirubrobacteraceae bacterium]